MNFMNIQHSTFNIQHSMRGHWIVRSLLGVFVAGMILSVSNGAEDTNAYPALNSFRIIQTRNIFDPNRRGGYVPNQTNHTPTRRLDAFQLVGTMSYSKGRFAFFDGSDSKYKKVVEPGGNIIGYTVKDVKQGSVTLAAGGKEFEMKIGAQMRNPGNNKWELSGHIIEDQTNDDTNGDSAAVESSAPPAGGNPQMNDILKQMMERRQQELK